MKGIEPLSEMLCMKQAATVDIAQDISQKYYSTPFLDIFRLYLNFSVCFTLPHSLMELSPS
jgi:hypothetical protein